MRSSVLRCSNFSYIRRRKKRVEAQALLRSPMALRKANVLVVDDKRANLLGLEAVLADEYNVIFANSGEESLDILEKRSDVDLILMDVQMPGMDGFETAQRIKGMPAGREIPIIFVTAICLMC